MGEINATRHIYGGGVYIDTSEAFRTIIGYNMDRYRTGT
jgi:hypothetical protein